MLQNDEYFSLSKINSRSFDFSIIKKKSNDMKSE